MQGICKRPFRTSGKQYYIDDKIDLADKSQAEIQGLVKKGYVTLIKRKRSG